ncbi:polysaccharide pyruvyl transferase family protein [Microbacterium sp. Leaf288]|uniref:polysaccharide pyruvyl transferase family protein n=1 Tax=Microbacterium sp. Leaf288 TaxID=1736323 RepID=UPI0009E7CED3|nr:polysaccharide pyruvyl transferase family protein [Microbacterium sp. Leaf288]
MTVRLLGGWGYFNLGDEALLAGYIETLNGEVDLQVGSVDPHRSSKAQLESRVLRQEGTFGRLAQDDVVILGGGGYLNGSWLPEIGRKLRRIAHDSRGVRVATHAVEVRGLVRTPLEERARKVLRHATATVRDRESQLELGRLDNQAAEIVPDAIALLTPHLDRYRTRVPELRGKVLLNLLDIARRPDSKEAELDPVQLVEFGRLLVERLGDRAVGLVIGEGDAEHLRSFGDIPILVPSTVPGLVSALASAAGVFSVRMHPGLIASALGTPTVSVPYCGKVRPTLDRIGTAETILTTLDIDQVMEQLAAPVDYSDRWKVAAGESRAALWAMVEKI